MAKKNDQTEHSPDEAFAEESASLRDFADLLDKYPEAEADDKKRLAGELHLTAPRTADSVRKIAKYLDEIHG